MRRLLRALALAGAAALFLPGPARAQVSCIGQTRATVAFAHEQVNVGGTAVGFTAATFQPSGTGTIPASLAIVTVDTNSIRYWVDGGTPTAAIGHQITSGQTFFVCGLPAIKAFLAIQVTAGAVLNVTYYHAAAIQ